MSRSESQNGVEFEVIEQCRCLRCDSAIPREHVVASVARQKPNTIAPTTQNVSVFCEFCDIVWELRRVLRDGNWHVAGAITIAHLPSRRRWVIDQIDAIKGNVQRRESDRLLAC